MTLKSKLHQFVTIFPRHTVEFISSVLLGSICPVSLCPSPFWLRCPLCPHSSDPLALSPLYPLSHFSAPRPYPHCCVRSPSPLLLGSPAHPPSVTSARSLLISLIVLPISPSPAFRSVSQIPVPLTRLFPGFPHSAFSLPFSQLPWEHWARRCGCLLKMEADLPLFQLVCFTVIR